jgi:hypothetical protein
MIAMLFQKFESRDRSRGRDPSLRVVIKVSDCLAAEKCAILNDVDGVTRFSRL